MQSFPMTSSAPYYDIASASGLSYMPSATDMPLPDDGVYGAYGPAGALPYGSGSSDLPRYPSSGATPSVFEDFFLGSDESPQTSGSDTGFSTLEELLATPLSDVSFDPTLETAVQLGYLDTFLPALSSTAATYSSLVHPFPFTST